MTKRDRQASEYATEAYEKTPTKRGVSHTSGGLDEIVQLKEALRRLADQDATLSACDGNVTVTMDATLTDEERDAVRFFATYGGPAHRANTLRKLLERLE